MYANQEICYKWIETNHMAYLYRNNLTKLNILLWKICWKTRTRKKPASILLAVRDNSISYIVRYRPNANIFFILEIQKEHPLSVILF